MEAQDRADWEDVLAKKTTPPNKERDVIVDLGHVGSTGSWSPKPFWTGTVRYETIFWVCFFVWTIYFIVDRFVGNFLPPLHTLNFEPLTNTSPLSVRFFDNFNRATGRLFISVCTALIWTQCKTSENLIQRYKPSWLVTGDMRSTHNRIHYLLGVWGLAIPMYIHILVLFVPVMLGQSTLQIVSGPPEGALTPFVKENGVDLFIIGGDVFRLILAVILFFFVLPISISNFLRRANFNVAHWMHVAGALAFSMDIMRGNHPHSQLFNAPMIVYFLIDRIAGLFIWKEVWQLVDRRSFDNGEVHVYFFKSNVDNVASRNVGNCHYVKVFETEPLLNFSHPYTVFYNRTNQSLAELNQDGVALVLNNQGKLVPTPVRATVHDGNPNAWDVGIVMRASPSNRGSHAFSVNTPKNDDLAQTWASWGPYMSEYAGLEDCLDSNEILILQCTSAGLAYILDFAFFLQKRGPSKQIPTVHVLLSTRSFELIQWASGVLRPMIDHYGWQLHARFTQAEGTLTEMREGPAQQEFRQRFSISSDSLEDLLETLSKLHVKIRPKVFFCGDPLIQWAAEVTATNYDAEFFRGSRFSAVGFPLFTRGRDKKLRCFACPKMRKGKKQVCWCNAFPLPIFY